MKKFTTNHAQHIKMMYNRIKQFVIHYMYEHYEKKYYKRNFH